jgi:hypothetical protein
MNKPQYKIKKPDSRCLTVENTEDRDYYKTKTFNNRKINCSKSYSNFNKYNLNCNNKINTENEIDFFKHPKLNFVPRINRHKRNLNKFININKENDNNIQTKTQSYHIKQKEKQKENAINKTYNNFNSFYKRKKRSISTEPNNDYINYKNKYINENQKDSELLNNRIRHSSTNVNSNKKQRKNNLTYANDYSSNYVCKNCFDKKMLEEKFPSLSKSMINSKEKLVDQFINENPFYFIDKMNNLEKKRIQSNLDNLSFKQRNVIPIYEQEINKPSNLRKEQLQLINEYSLNPLAIEHGKDPKFLEQKVFFDRKEKLIQNNPDIYPGLVPRKAFQDYYEKCMYQIPSSEENYTINPVYKKNYIKALKKQISDKENRERDLILKTKKAEYIANKNFNEYKKREKLNEMKKSKYNLQMFNKDNKKLEEYKKYKKENMMREEEKFGQRLDLMKDKENKDYRLRYKKEKNMDCEMYQKMFDEMNQKREKKIYDRNEEKRKWNNYLDKYNMRYGYKNRYNNCDRCNKPIQKNQKLKKYPPPKENVVNVNF